jgi:predicted dehydrogenase
MDTVRIGVIGCGEITQLRHLPYLCSIPGFDVVALTDESDNILKTIGPRYGVRKLTRNYADILDDPGVDAVAILNWDHTAAVLDSLAAGKHIFVEKPLCFTTGDADRMSEAAAKSDRVSMVGFMKRYDPAFQAFQKIVQSMEDVRYFRAHDFRGSMPKDRGLRSKVGVAVRRTDIPAEHKAEVLSWRIGQISEMLGFDAKEYYPLFLLMFMGGSHDLSVMRGLFGEPKAVTSVQRIAQSELVISLEYENLRGLFEMGTWPWYSWWDEQLTVYGSKQIAHIQFVDPWFPNISSEVTVKTRRNDEVYEERGPLSYEDPFRNQLRHFYDCATRGIPPLTSIADAAAEVHLTVDILRRVIMAERSGRSA